MLLACLGVGDSMARKKSSKSAFMHKWRAAPLKSSYMLISILGFFITAYIIYPRSANFGIASMLVFVLMFIASIVSMTKAPV